MICSISWLHLNKSAPTFRTGLTFVMIKKRGNNPILTSKLYVLFHFLTPSKEICSKLSQQGSFFVTIKKRGNNPIWTSKLYGLSISWLHLNESAPNFHNRAHFCDNWREGYQPYTNFKIVHFVPFLDSI